MSNIKKNSLISVFLTESEEPRSSFISNASKTDKNIDVVAKKRDDKKIKDVNKELDTYKSILEEPSESESEASKTSDKNGKKQDDKKIKDVNKELTNYKSILEGPFDDAFEKHNQEEEEKENKEKNKKNLTSKIDDPFSNNLQECGMELDSPEHEAMETPEEETAEHMPGGSEYQEPVDHIIITIGHDADDKMLKTGQPAFNIGKGFGAPGSPNFKDGIDDSEHSLEEIADSDEMNTENTPGNSFDTSYEEDLTMMQESFDPRRWQKLAGMLKECPMEESKKTVKEEMDPFNGLADDPDFDDEGLPIEKEKDLEDKKFAGHDKRSDRPGK